ncbi:hypothetical protein [Aquimarina latercula]|uniref:hypothetical protein n=1 Tax=Aquimarina latercula TaxID=987 RepID=UPI0003FDC006|nr:hypothetical protein [Aquimarina latercula]
MKELYTTIIERLTSEAAAQTYRNAGIPALKHIDLYRGQYFNPEAFETFRLPGLLFEFTVAYQGTTGVASITLHLMYEQGRDTSSISQSRDKALQLFDFVKVTHQLIEELESPNTGKLELISEELLRDDAVVSVYLLSYQAPYYGRNKEKYQYAQGEDVNITGRIREFF